MILRLADLTRDEVSDCAPDAIVLIPVGSTEQHGPHLPMLTDTLLVEAVLSRACAHLEPVQATFVVAPSLPIGCSDHHLFASALSVRPATLQAVLADATDSLVASGFRRLALVNGHGGNDECVRLAVKELILRRSVAAMACSYWELLGDDVDLGSDVPGHAGHFETSLMLAAYPNLVRENRLPTERLGPHPRFDQHEIRGLTVQVAGEWSRAGGVTDPAAASSVAEGDYALGHIAAALARALAWFDSNTRDFSRPQAVKADERRRP